MGVIRPLTISLLLLLALLLASCGGTADSLSSDYEAVQTVQPEVEANADAASALELESSADLPGIPLEEGVAPEKGASAAGDQVVLGKDFILQHNSSVDGDALVIGTADSRLAFGMYKAGGLLGLRPRSLNVECMPQQLNEPYFVGVADYTTGRWFWSGPVTLPEYQLDLTQRNHQFVSHLGNLYFLIVTHEGNVASHSQTTVVSGEPQPGDGPGLPHHLVASDGLFAHAVKLNWIPGNAAQSFEVWRRPLFGGNWEQIGLAQQPEYLDVPLPEWRMFMYRVRSVNSGGQSGWSNIDSGFAGEREPAVIAGRISGPGGQPLPGIPVRLVGADEWMLRRTDDQGRYRFEGLAPGRYLVAPASGELNFVPPYRVADLNNAVFFEANFSAVPDDWFHRAAGFVFTLAPPPAQEGTPPPDAAPGELIPMPGVKVVLLNPAKPQQKIEVVTNQDGFYLFEHIPDGIWMLSPVAPDFNFMPGPQQLIINGLNRPDRHDFAGLPKLPGSGEGGGEDGAAGGGGEGDGGEGEA